MSEIRRVIDQIRLVQDERKNADYFDTDWNDSLADLAISLADLVEPQLKGRK